MLEIAANFSYKQIISSQNTHFQIETKIEKKTKERQEEKKRKKYKAENKKRESNGMNL